MLLETFLGKKKKALIGSIKGRENVRGDMPFLHLIQLYVQLQSKHRIRTLKKSRGSGYLPPHLV